MMKKQIDRVDAIVCRFHTMFSNAYQVVSEDELQDIMNNVAPVKDDEDIIKKWDEGN